MTLKLRSAYAYQQLKFEVPNKHIKYAYHRGRTVDAAYIEMGPGLYIHVDTCGSNASGRHSLLICNIYLITVTHSGGGTDAACACTCMTCILNKFVLFRYRCTLLLYIIYNIIYRACYSSILQYVMSFSRSN